MHPRPGVELRSVFTKIEPMFCILRLCMLVKMTMILSHDHELVHLARTNNSPRFSEQQVLFLGPP